MKYIFGFDSETTGKVDFRAPSDAEHQPRLVQLAALLVDADTREVAQSMDVIIKPDGWTIPDEAANVHGITTEHATKVGVPENIAVRLFYYMWQRCDCRVAHNEPFDAKVIRGALKRHMNEQMADDWKAGRRDCTMRLSTPIVKCPPTEKMLAAGFNRYKSANLSEAYKYFTGKDLEGAHRAIVDVEACLAVYWAITDGQTEAAIPDLSPLAEEA